MKIAICGMIKSPNLGDKFIADSLAWIIKEEMKERGIREMPVFVFVDIMATNDVTAEYSSQIASCVHNLYDYSYWGIPNEYLYRALNKIAKSIKQPSLRNTVYKLKHVIWRHSQNFGKRHIKYFQKKFKDVDLIIIAGGGLLEYSYNEYQESLNLITLYAEKHSIPVIVNAIGRAGKFDRNDYRCQVLMETFQRNCVKYVSARDSRESVQECVGKRLNVKLLADAAFCVSEAYNISANSEKKLIGIGLLRETGPLSYTKNGYNKTKWIDLFCDIVKELSNRGYQWEFFTNGFESDYRFGLQLVSKLGIPKEKLVERPVDETVLLKTISKYSGLITCRMHSSIAAFSLGIPSIILSWNDKVDKYMDIAGYPQRAVKQDNFNSKYIVNLLEQALKEGISVENRSRMKIKARESVKDYMDLII